MGLRFFKRIKILPGLTLNLSKRGFSFSAGPRGAKFTFGTSGARASLGLPGTGISYTKKLFKKKPSSVSIHKTGDKKTGFFKRFFMSSEEKKFFKAYELFCEGRAEEAYSDLEDISYLPDAAFLLGIINLDTDKPAEAALYFEKALEKKEELGRIFSKYKPLPLIEIQINPEFKLSLEPGLKALVLALAEAWQLEKKIREAALRIEELLEKEPDDLVLKLSLVDLLFEEKDEPSLKKILHLLASLKNDSPLHAFLLLYRARALKILDMLIPARDTYTDIIRKSKDRPEDFLRLARYERAEVYAGLGQGKRAEEELYKIYGEDPAFKDVESLLDLK